MKNTSECQRRASDTPPTKYQLRNTTPDVPITHSHPLVGLTMKHLIASSKRQELLLKKQLRATQTLVGAVTALTKTIQTNTRVSDSCDRLKAHEKYATFIVRNNATLATLATLARA